MINYRHLYRLLFLLCWLPSSLYALPSTLILTDKTPHIGLMPYVDMLEDPTGELTLEEVTSGVYDFHTLPVEDTDKALDMGFTQSAFWLRVRMINQSDQVNLYFTHWGGLSRQVTVYLRSGDDKSFVELELIDHSRSMQYPFYSPHGTSHTLYFRVRDKHTSLVISPEFKTAPILMKQVMAEYPFYSMMIGGLLVLALYNFIYFIHMRDRGFLALSLFIVAFVLEIGNHSGLLHYYPFLRENLQSVGSLFGFIVIASGLSLFDHWLDIRRNLPQWHIRLRYVFWMSYGLALSSPFVPYSVAFAGVWGGGVIVLIAVTYGVLYRKGLHLPFSMNLSALIFIVSIVPALLRAVGLIEEVSWLADVTFLTLLVSLILLSLTQAEQVRSRSEQAERIAASNKSKDEFLTTMSHELRTPMNAVVGAGNLLKLTSLSNEQEAFVSRLNTSSQHMLSLINDILDLARVDSSLLPMENIPFKLDTVLQQVEELLLEQAHSKHLVLTLENGFNPLKKQLLGDPTRLQQILLNLLNNAIKFTLQGEVSLTVTPQKISSESATLLIEVHDSGIGMSVEQQQKLFRPFSQADSSTSRKYGGSGLGLAISYKLVQRMGGELKVASRAERGSRFFFTLTFPLQDIFPEMETSTVMTTPTIASTSATITSLASLRILLVDDDDINLFLGKELFKTLGVQVETAESGEQAIRYIKAQTFDLVFMDVSMPEMDGYETTRRIRADGNFSDLPVIALTAHAIIGERERCLAAGMNDYLTKPYELEQLQKMIQYWRFEQEQRA